MPLHLIKDRVRLRIQIATEQWLPSEILRKWIFRVHAEKMRIVLRTSLVNRENRWIGTGKAAIGVRQKEGVSF